MTDSPPKPKRRRWRSWTICVMLLSAGLGVLWFWTRSDPRFVGKWQIVVEQQGQAVITDEVLWYDSNGTCRQAFGRKETPGTMRWRVSGDEFLIDSRSAVGFDRLKQDAVDIWTLLRYGRVQRPSDVRFTIISVTQNEITLRTQPQGTNAGYIVRNRRLAE